MSFVAVIQLIQTNSCWLNTQVSPEIRSALLISSALFFFSSSFSCYIINFYLIQHSFRKYIENFNSIFTGTKSFFLIEKCFNKTEEVYVSKKKKKKTEEVLDIWNTSVMRLTISRRQSSGELTFDNSV